MNMMEVEEKPLCGSPIDPEAEISVADMQDQLQESALPTDDLNLCESVPGVVTRGDDDQEMLHCPDEKNQADVQVDDADVHQLPENKITNSDTCDGKVDDASLHQLPENNITISNTCTGNHLKVDAPASPKKSSPKKSSLRKAPEMKYGLDDSEMGEADESGTSEERVAFMMELESFYKENALEFKPPKFYGEPLNCLKLWRAVIRLGGYDVVTAAKLWRQVGESFHPPKTCTTVSWTFRIFYEKALLEYEKHKKQIGELQFPVVGSHVQSAGIDEEGSGYQAPGSGRARRDSAARAMQGWHAQKLISYGEVAEPVIKDKNLNSTAKREKNLKSIGFLKHKNQINTELNEKASNIDSDKQLITTIVDVGQPADWVKITVRETKDSFEVYALVPGLLREEERCLSDTLISHLDGMLAHRSFTIHVRVQSDPAGRLVITGQPQQLDNPWGITPFKKVVTLPGRIDPLQTSAVVSLHGRLFVRVPFERGSV